MDQLFKDIAYRYAEWQVLSYQSGMSFKVCGGLANFHTVYKRAGHFVEQC